MIKRRWITLLGAYSLFLLPWAVLEAGEHGGASCAPPLPESAYRISSPYGMRMHPRAGVRRMHFGVDLACPMGTPVHAVSGGVVAFAGRLGCYGKVLMLRHPGDVMTLYAHLSRIAPSLRPGVFVCKGQVVALSGATGCVTGSHLHFEVWKAGRRVNPMLACASLRSRRAPLLKFKEVTEMGLVVNFMKDLDTAMLKPSPVDVVTGRDLCGGFHFWGVNGAGKTTSAQMVAGACLRAGFGGYVTAAKPGVIAQWQEAYAPMHGRGNSLVLFDENEGFNFLDYLMARYGMDGIGTVVECLMRVIDASRRASGTASQRGGDVFWDDSARNALRYALPPLYSAKGSLTIPDILRFITTAPATVQEPTSREWQERAFMYKIMNAAANNPRERMQNASLQNVINFWKEQWPAIPERTRGNIVITITAALDRFNHGRLNRCFCGKTTIVPEMSFHGAVIVDAKPTLTWNEDGVIAQQLFKFIWQRAVLSRNSLEEKHRERFVFLWSDEAQETVAPYDGEFLGLARESKCCTVYLTQSLPTYFAKIGGDSPRDAALALAGKFKTHVFCANACPETNEFASRMIGKVLTRRGNFSAGSSHSLNEGMSAGNSENTGSSSSYGSSSGQSYSFNSNSGSSSGSGNNFGNNRGRGSSENVSRGYSESMEYVIEPGDFARMLKTGGPENGNIVTAVWFQAGRVFKASGTNWLLARFKQ
jgi:uncharacterized membrane protein YgcG